MKGLSEEESEPFIVTADSESGGTTTTLKLEDENENKKSFKQYLGNIIAFVLLTVQTAVVVLTMRYSRIEHSSSSESDLPSFGITAAVMFAEIGKCFVGIIVTLYDISISPEYKNKTKFIILYNEIFNDYKVVLKMSVPAILYSIQNNLLFTALSNLDSAFYQILYQLKTFSAAILAVIMLKRVYTKYQWLSFLCLAVGAILANLSVIEGVGENNKINGDPIIGIICVLCATLTSGFCGVYMEKELKGSKQSLYIKNIQLGMFGALGCIINSYFIGDLQNIFIPYGITHGFTKITWFVVVLNIFGGYLVAWIIKYIENIAKAFASTTALVLIVAASYFLFETQLNYLFGIGFIFVLTGNILFNHKVLYSS